MSENQCGHYDSHMTMVGAVETWFCDDCGTKVYDDSDTLGGRLRVLEAEAKRLGAPGVIAGIDQIRARNREATEAAIRSMFGPGAL